MTSLKHLMLFAAKYTGAFRYAGWATRQRMRIFSYAGFADNAPPRGHISLRCFETRMRRIHQSCYPVLSLDEAAGCLARGDLPDHATVILIDEGARGRSEGAVAVLQHYHFPVTFSALGGQYLPPGLFACEGGGQSRGKKRVASNPGFKSDVTTCYNFIWLRDREEIDAIEFEAELSGFLDICRGLARQLGGSR